MPPWLSHVRSANRKESKFNSSRWLQLATIGIDNSPRVRTVVFRGWSESFEMNIYTDKRSQKYHELDSNNKVELCWLFVKSKCQFRFRGTSRIDLGNDKTRHWEKLSENSKSMWSWPTPGDQYINNTLKDLSINTKHFPSKNFTLLKIEIKHVDQLLLKETEHIRRRWIKKREWIEERINP